MSTLKERSKEKLESLKKSHDLKKLALDFILNGIGCNCLVLLHSAGVLEDLTENRLIKNEQLSHYKNPILIQSALTTLEKCDVLEKSIEGYFLTDFGYKLVDYVGLNNMLFDGYSDLISNQLSVYQEQIKKPNELIRGDSIAKSSILFGENTIDPLILREFQNLKFSGTICDLGCGIGTRLSALCNITNNPGLGFEYDTPTVKLADKYFKNNSNISILEGDITNLDGVWEDVIVLMQYFVLHDFVPTEKCVHIINGFVDNFPNLQYFYYVDIVSPSAKQNEIMPGFDYVHGLQNIQTRTYEETIEMFNKSNFCVVKEEKVPGLPNTFLWVLSPKK